MPQTISSGANTLVSLTGSPSTNSPATISLGVTLSAGLATDALADWSVYNQGYISGTNTGVSLSGLTTALLNNAATGQIYGGAFAVRDGGVPVTVTNLGKIGNSLSNNGVYLSSGGLIANQTGGTIAASAAGVYFAAGGTVTNQAGGRIFATQNAIMGANSAATVVNAGTIGGTAASAGINLTAGGSAINQSGGLIDGSANAILASNNPVTVVNTGQIGDLASGTGLNLSAGGSVTNQGGGIILATPSSAGGNGVALGASGQVYNLAGGTIGGYSGIFSGGAAATVVNAGMIGGTASTNGIYLTSGGQVTNQTGGTIDGSANALRGTNSPVTVVNAGLIGGTAAGTGLNLAGDGWITNQSGGTILATTANNGGNGIALAQGGHVTNLAGATIAGYNGIFAGGTAEVINAGTLGGGASSNGAYLQHGGSVTNQTGGYIAGQNDAIQSQGGQTFVLNAGTVDGAIALPSGFANVVTAMPSAVFTGTVDGGNGLTGSIVSTLELGGGSGTAELNGLGSQFINFGRIVADAGAAWTLSGDTTLSGTLALQPGANLTLNSWSGAGETVAFSGSGSTLEIGSAGGAPAIGSFQPAAITGFTAGNTIVVDTAAPATFQTNGNSVAVVSNGATLVTLTFGSAPGGTLTDSVACFAAGTRIGTQGGPVDVGSLTVGDTVTTVLGGDGRIVWVGKRSVNCRRHPKPETVWPIRILPGAFGPGMPERALFVSPDHAIYIDGVLIPAKFLIDGRNVRQMRVAKVVYHHIELAAHDVVLAEGLPAETYLDTGDRAKFSGGPVQDLYPDFAARTWEMEGCAPLVLTGERLETARRKLAKAGFEARTQQRRRPMA